jgi:outer membrane biosynthesis protein TonB
MRNKLIFLLILFFYSETHVAVAQSSTDFFNRAARSYVKTETDQALKVVNDGLGKFPSDAKLQALKEKLEKEKEEQEQEQKNKEQQDKQNQQQQQDQDKDQKSQGEQEQQEQQKDGEKTEEDKAKESQKGDPSEKSQDPAKEGANDQMDADLADKQKAMEAFKEKLKEMNLTPEQAGQILESMNAAELRYIQQNKKKPTQKPKRGLPDW